MRLSDFHFELPASLVALEPAPERDSSRLLVLGRDGRTEHKRFSDIADCLLPGDMLLLNRTKVLPFRLVGRKRGGGALDVLLVRNLGGKRWEVLSKGGYTGPLFVSDRLSAEIEGGRAAELHYDGDLRDILWLDGQMPLPPYIRREADARDKERYQTVYARDEGSIAAPTAGLHFTEGLLKSIEAKGVHVRYLTLHVGRGTFAPIRAERVEEHVMESEAFEVEAGLLDEIVAHKGRLIAVGTTATRAIEGLLSGRSTPTASANGVVRGTTDIFIRPGYEFRAVGGLVTNFHLPCSTPLMLTAALAGRERLLSAYRAAVDNGYRFFSYGDAMLVA